MHSTQNAAPSWIATGFISSSIEPVEWEVTYSLLISIGSLLLTLPLHHLTFETQWVAQNIALLCWEGKKKKNKVRKISLAHFNSGHSFAHTHIHTRIYRKMAIGTFVFNSLVYVQFKVNILRAYDLLLASCLLLFIHILFSPSPFSSPFPSSNKERCDQL